jgi:hypothetical protein
MAKARTKAMELDLGDQGRPLRTLGCGDTI